jgi:hypothetical protein
MDGANLSVRLGRQKREDVVRGLAFLDLSESPSGEGRLVGLVQLVRNSPYGQP